MTTERICELAEAYALGALDAGDARAFEAHLPGCSDCPRVVREQREVAVLLAETASAVAPDAALRERVLARFREERRTVVPIRPRPRAPWLAIAAAAAGLILAGTEAWRANRTSRELAQLRASFDSVRGRLGVVEEQRSHILDASTALYRLTATSDSAARMGAQVFWSRDQQTWLLHAFNLPRLPEGRVYQLWFVTAAAKISAGVLDPDAEGHAVLLVSVPPAARASIVGAISDEPSGGSPQPTGPIVLAGSVAATE